MSGEVSGLLVIDKPQGVTSHDLVAAVRAALHMKRVGHAGTLDPMATGVLVIGFGCVTRLLSYIVGHDKTYETTILLGQGTTTDDADGDPLPRTADEAQAVAERIHRLTDDDIRAAAARLTGDIRQVPSAFSAKKIHGQKAYDLARNGDVVKLEAQSVTVSAFDILDIRRTEAPTIAVDARVTCSTGTYIRALGRDMGADLGVGGHLTRLRRTRVGSFRVDDPAVVTAHVEDHTFVNRDGQTVTRPRAVLDITDRDALLARALTPADAARRGMPSIEVTPAQADYLEHGRLIDGVVDVPTAAICADPSSPGGERLVALVERRTRTQLKPSVVFR
ncbi:tRNA pseudouridine(55) synthase TruB [Pseudoscardovia radai]|uniref:tRNA pseudouridine(55) synthase TruB n=1 Tax=Pseudoscardovia radai TaxID=987066 RepID=UPI003996BCE1